MGSIIIKTKKRKHKGIFLFWCFVVLKCLHHCDQLSKLSEQLNNNKSLVKFSNSVGGQSTSPCRATRGLIATSWQLPFPNAHAQCKTEKVKVIFSLNVTPFHYNYSENAILLPEIGHNDIFYASNTSINIYMRITKFCLHGRSSIELIQILMCSLTVITVKDALLLKYVSEDNQNYLFMLLKGISLLLKHYHLLFLRFSKKGKNQHRAMPNF